MGIKIPEDTDWMRMPCGGLAFYDEPTYGANYFCAQCECVIGSEQMPKECKDIEAKYELVKLLGGEGWDYFAELHEEY